MVLDLPFAAMLDTTVFLRRLGEQPDDPAAPACIDFCNRMVKERRQLFVAAPTITEVLGFGLHLAYVMSLPRRPEPILAGLETAPGVRGILEYCRRHRLTGVA